MSSVDHPDHYNTGNLECIDVMKEAFGTDAVRDFCKLNAFKYIWREELKNGTEDLEKAAWYLNQLVRMEKGQDPDEPEEDHEVTLTDMIGTIADGIKECVKIITDTITIPDKRYRIYQDYREKGFTDEAAFTLAMHTKLEDENEME